MTAPPSLETLVNIPGITHVEHITDTRFRLQFSTNQDITKKIVELSVANEWHLHDYSRKRFSRCRIRSTVREKYLQIKKTII